jgi:hypothetical protein
MKSTIEHDAILQIEEDLNGLMRNLRTQASKQMTLRKILGVRVDKSIQPMHGREAGTDALREGTLRVQIGPDVKTPLF